MTDHELVVSGLSVAYGKATAVDQMELTASGGAVTAVVGPNGAGKSSLVLGIYGSVAATGSVLVDGRDVSGLSPMQRARAGIAIVPQGRQLFPRMTVLENITIMAEMLRLRGDAVGQALERFPILRDRKGALAGVLSGGEQQMLVVTRALMAEPSVILLDEMMTGLAPKIVQSLASTIAELAASGVVVVMADPTLAHIKGIVDRGYVLVRGHLVAQAPGAAELQRAYEDARGIIQEEIESEVAETA
ncbi:MAG: ATP-binding cassette domain-containing protein [Lapillicoccus sp.]